MACPSSPAGVRTISGPGYQSAAQFYTAHFLTPYIRQVDVWGGYTAAAGHQLYTARSFPKKYWNRIAFITEPTAHLVGQGIMEPQGAGFVTRDGWNLIAGAEEWFSPVHAQVALHMIIGMGLMIWMLIWAYNGTLGDGYYSPVRSSDSTGTSSISSGFSCSRCSI